MSNPYAWLEQCRQRIIDFQSELVAAKGVGPASGGEGEAAKLKVVEKWLTDAAPDELIRADAPDSRVPGGVRPNLAARFKGASARRKAAILSHLDVVGAGEATAWESDPWTLRVEGDRLFGRGVEDNNSSIVSSVLALTALRKSGVFPPVAVDLVFVADEENGSQYGLAHLLASRPDIFTPDDLVFVPDAGEADGGLAVIAEKGIAAFKFTVTGEQRHASAPAGGNSLRAAARLIAKFDEVMPRRFSARNAFFNPPVSTFEPTRMDANVESTNIIPGRNVFYYDARILPEYDLREVEAEFRRAAGTVAAAEGVRIEVEPVNCSAAGPVTSPASPAVQALAAAVAETHGVKLRTIGIGGGTLANFIRQKGIPAVVYSAMLDNPHVPNECALASNQIKDAMVWARIILAMGGASIS